MENKNIIVTHEDEHEEELASQLVDAPELEDGIQPPSAAAAAAMQVDRPAQKARPRPQKKHKASPPAARPWNPATWFEVNFQEEG